MPENLLDGYYDRKQLAKALGKNARTIDRWVSLGVAPPSVIVGNRRLFHKITLWLEAGGTKARAREARRPIRRNSAPRKGRR